MLFKVLNEDGTPCYGGVGKKCHNYLCRLMRLVSWAMSIIVRDLFGKGEKMNKEIARKAAKWWADQLRGRSKLDHGDHSLTGAMTIAMAEMLQAREKKRQTPELIDKFEQELVKIIIKRRPWSIGVDYHPDHILREAADNAGLDLGMTTLPWKTVMWIEEDRVRVACGYRAEPIDLTENESV